MSKLPVKEQGHAGTSTGFSLNFALKLQLFKQVLVCVSL